VGAGKAYRMGRIFGADGRTLVLPVDHGLVLGRVEGLEDPVGRVDGLLDLPCDGLLMAPGLTRHTAARFARRDAPARLLTLDTFFREPGEEAAGAGMAAGVELGARLGVDAVKVFMAWNVPSGERAATVARIADVVARAEGYDMPVMVEPIAIGAPRDKAAIALEGDAARVAMEAGADIIKVAYPGPEPMAAWASELQVPLVILGGPRSGEADAVLDLAREALAHGARGLVIGRNVWQRPPDVTRRLMRALHEIVHQPSAPAASSRDA
jgi:fructose-bisphosphate aldolase, class I